MPRIYEEELPEADRRGAKLISRCLDQVSSEVEDFKAAVALADHASAFNHGPRPDIDENRREEFPAWIERRKQFGSWLLLGARQGAIAIYNVHELLQAINKLLSGAPTMRDMVGRAALSEANKLHVKSFPNFTALRFTVVHAGWFAKDPEKHRPDGQDLFVSNSLCDRTFITHANGENASYELTWDTAEILTTIANHLVDAFSPAAQATRKLWLNALVGGARLGIEEP